ncbi:MAG: helix-turn-helix domain-containing protein [Thermoanaerobaculia bacterium]
MQLSVAETATVLAKTPRQVRYMIRQGRLKAERQGKSWRIDSDSLPLGDAERQALKERLDVARGSVDAALEPVAKALDKSAKGEEERYSVRKLLAFETGRRLYQELAAGSASEQPGLQALFDGLVQLTQGCHAFRAEEKAGHFRAARRLVATATAHLFLCGDERGAEVAAKLEQELIPKIGGLVAAQEKGGRKSSRFDRFGSASRSGERR